MWCEYCQNYCCGGKQYDCCPTCGTAWEDVYDG